MAAEIVLQKVIQVEGSISGTSMEVTYATQEDQWPPGTRLEDMFADCGNYEIIIPTVRVLSAQTVNPSGANITNAKVDLALKTVDTLEDWWQTGLDPAPNGPAWIVYTDTIVDVSTQQSPQREKCYRRIKLTAAADNTGSEHPLVRWVFWELQCTSGGTAGMFYATFEIRLICKGRA